MAKGILFDFNGTLFFDSELHVKAFEIIFLRFGRPKPTREFIISNILGRTDARIYRDNFDPDASDEVCANFHRQKMELYFELCLERQDIFKLTDGAVEMLDHLKASGIPFTIATGSDGNEVDFFFKHLGLGKWFDKKKIIFTNGTFNGKPAPDCYLLAAEKIGLPASDCIVFEDGTSGVKAAINAGVEGIVAVHESTVPSPLNGEVKVDAVYNDLSDWKNILSRYNLM